MDIAASTLDNLIATYTQKINQSQAFCAAATTRTPRGVLVAECTVIDTLTDVVNDLRRLTTSTRKDR